MLHQITRYNPATKYGQRKAKEAAQRYANKTGRTVYLQTEYSTHGVVYVAIADGRGPLLLNAPWREFHPVGIRG